MSLTLGTMGRLTVLLEILQAPETDAASENVALVAWFFEHFGRYWRHGNGRPLYLRTPPFGGRSRRTTVARIAFIVAAIWFRIRSGTAG